MLPLNPLTRRSFIAGTGLIATIGLLGPPARGENDDFRVIRATDAGYDGAAPGPVLSVRRGEELKVRLVNERSVETAIHWHGVRVPNAMDGTALVQRPIAPSASFDYRFTPPDAGTFWYHPPPHTAQNRALHGLLIVHEISPPNVDDDVAVIIGSADEKLSANGVAALDIPVRPESRLRLRLANAAERFVMLRIEDHPVTVMAIDGQPAEPFRSRESRITLAPGNRADVFIDAVMKPGSIAPIIVRNDDAAVPIARLVYGNAVVTPPATAPRDLAGDVIKPLEPNPLPAKMDFRGALRAELAVDKVNDLKASDMKSDLPAKPLFSAKSGRTVMLALTNKSSAPCVAHIHGHHVRLLDNLDDGWKPFWLDTILCVPQQTTRVAFVADNAGKWLLSSRALGGSEALTWFEVT